MPTGELDRPVKVRCLGGGRRFLPEGAPEQEPGEDDVIRKVQVDLTEKGVGVTDAELRSELARAAGEARRQLTES